MTMPDLQARSPRVSAVLSSRCSLNLLLIGPAEDAEEFLQLLVPSLASPIVYLDSAKPELPTRPTGTLIVGAIERLTPSSQVTLLEWLHSMNVPPRVIGTAARSLFPKERRREFSDRLYYCLNAVVVDLNSLKHVGQR